MMRDQVGQHYELVSRFTLEDGLHKEKSVKRRRPLAAPSKAFDGTRRSRRPATAALLGLTFGRRQRGFHREQLARVLTYANLGQYR